MKKVLLLSVVLIISCMQNMFAAIDFSVSPIKYEIDIAPGEVVTKKATLYNNSNLPVIIYMGKSDFQSKDSSGVPRFVRYSELVHPDQQLSTWVSINIDQFEIQPNTQKEIEFTISVPELATPGGHYGAIFFKNPGSETSTSGNIGINVDYGVLLLVNVAGDIDTELEIEEPIIVNNQQKGGYAKKDTSFKNLVTNISYVKTDNCLFDFTNSNYDKKCFDSPKDFFTKSNISKDDKGNDNDISINSGENGTVKNVSDVEDTSIEEDFGISFSFPIKNSGNTHVKPVGEIILIDEDGKQIEGVGKKNRINEEGAIVGVEVVDYIPINDDGGNVLPGSKRNFEAEWNGFPYQTLDEGGKIVMKDMSPEEYYSNKNVKEDLILMPWERICFRKNDKIVNALINLQYTDEDGQEVEFSSAKKLAVSYNEKYVGLNYYLIIPALIFIVVFFLLWIIALGKRRKCINKKCRKKIKRSVIRCPYCDKKQRKKIKKEK